MNDQCLHGIVCLTSLEATVVSYININWYETTELVEAP